MGYIFEKNDVTVWSPSLDVARLFLASVRQLEQQVHLPSGLAETMSDTIEIDPNLLLEFVRTLFLTSNTSNQSLSILLHGPIVHLIALLYAVMPSAQVPTVQEKWNEEAKSLMRGRIKILGAE